jgi:hypothetical protein
MPVDVVKTRLQFDGAVAGAARQYSGSLNCATSLVGTEGVQALFKGLPPALLRQSVYGSLRYGLYTPIRDLLNSGNSGSATLWQKVVAGASAGASASALANPTDLIKVRMQTDGMSSGAAVSRKYCGVVHCFQTTLREEGVVGLWKGVGPTMGRATALAAAELATYDEVKLQLRQQGIIENDGLFLHTCTAFVSGFVSTVASSPFDVVKSRVMGQPVDATGKGTLYSGMLDCFSKSFLREGAFSLYRGFWPNFGRVVPRVTLVFIVMEQLKVSLG